MCFWPLKHLWNIDFFQYLLCVFIANKYDRLIASREDFEQVETKWSSLLSSKEQEAKLELGYIVQEYPAHWKRQMQLHFHLKHHSSCVSILVTSAKMCSRNDPTEQRFLWLSELHVLHHPFEDTIISM